MNSYSSNLRRLIKNCLTIYKKLQYQLHEQRHLSILDSIGCALESGDNHCAEDIEAVFNLCSGMREDNDIRVDRRCRGLLMRIAGHKNTPKHILAELVNHQDRCVSYQAKQHPTMANYVPFE
jgi:hypothetical protein